MADTGATTPLRVFSADKYPMAGLPRQKVDFAGH